MRQHRRTHEPPGGVAIPTLQRRCSVADRGGCPCDTCVRSVACTRRCRRMLGARARRRRPAVNADAVPWPRWQGRLRRSAAAPLARRSCARRSEPTAGRSAQPDGRLLLRPAAARRDARRRLPRDQRRAHRPAQRSCSAPRAGHRRSGSASAGAVGAGPARSAGRHDGRQPTLPYLGIGYTRPVAARRLELQRRPRRRLAEPGNAVRLGRVFGGAQSLDDVVRDMRLSPVLQLGVSYSF